MGHRNGTIVRYPPGASGVQSLAVVYRPGGQEIAAAFSDGTIRILDPTRGPEELRLDCHIVGGSGPVVACMLAYDPTGRWLAACSTPSDRAPGEVWVFDAATGQRISTLPHHTSSVVAVAFHPNGKRIASASLDRTIKLWETETGQEVLTLRGHKSGVLSVAFSPDGRRLARREASTIPSRSGMQRRSLPPHGTGREKDQNQELTRFRAEAEAPLQEQNIDAMMPNGAEAFAR